MDSDYLQERQVFRRRVIACYGEKMKYLRLKQIDTRREVRRQELISRIEPLL